MRSDDNRYQSLAEQFIVWLGGPFEDFKHIKWAITTFMTSLPGSHPDDITKGLRSHRANFELGIGELVPKLEGYVRFHCACQPCLGCGGSCERPRDGGTLW